MKSSFLTTWSMARSAIFSMSIVVYLTFTLTGFAVLKPLLSILCASAILLSIVNCGRSAKIYSLLFLGGGTWFLVQSGTDVYNYLLSFGDMMFLLALFALVPLLALPIKIGKYGESIELLMERKPRTDAQYYRVISGLSFLLGSFLNLATLPIMYHSLRETVRKWAGDKTDKFLLSAIIHGFGASVTWAPVSGVPGVVLTITAVRWQDIMLTLLGISIGGVLLSWAIYTMLRRLGPRFRLIDQGPTVLEIPLAAALDTGPAQDSNPAKKIVQISLAIVALVIAVLAVSEWFELNVVLISSLIAFPFALVWSLCLRKGDLFMKGTFTHLKDHLPAMSDQFAIFLSAGFFVKALHDSGYDHYVNQTFVDISQAMGGQALLFLLPILILAFSFIGLHPFAVIALLGQSLNAELLGLTPEQLTISLAGGAVMTFLVGPVSGTTGVASSLIRKGPFHVAGWSAWQALGYFAVLVIFLLFY